MNWVLVLLVVVTACRFDSSGSGAGSGADGGVTPGSDGGAGSDAAPDATPNTDSDGDGVFDVSDNCPATQNPDQFDEDGDLVGDACDNCPHIANVDQANDMENEAGETPDQIGDACDPRPSGGGDEMVLFDGFNSPLAAEWIADSGTWGTNNGSLEQTSAGGGLQVAYWSGARLADVAIQTAVVYTQIPPGGAQNSFRSAGALAAFDPSGTGRGYECAQNLDVSDNNPSVLMVTLLSNSSGLILDSSSVPVLATGVEYDYRFTSIASDDTLRCELSGGDSATTSASDGTFADGFPALRTFGVQARYPYVVIYSPGGQ